ncbi:MAG: zinc-ribbon domain-containing protein [Cyanobacteria bacterium SZAS LIN-3]|nr:zinc-ribbon domain-containing protein [Cyanobacteria bacterium SZAS LIN-3]
MATFMQWRQGITESLTWLGKLALPIYEPINKTLFHIPGWPKQIHDNHLGQRHGVSHSKAVGITYLRRPISISLDSLEHSQMRKRPIVEIEDMAEPFCGKYRKSTVPLNDAAPEVAFEWLYAKNCGWGPEHVSRASGVRAWWKCSTCNREYKAQINNRTANGSACPYCASKRVCDDNSFAVLFPEIAKEWHPTKNRQYKVTEVMHASSKRAWWLCSKCKHSWECAIADRTGLGSGCPACYEARMEYAREHPSTYETPQRILSEKTPGQSHWYTKPSSENFVSLYEFSKTLARQWHPTKNGKIGALDISRGSDAIAWWKCKKGPDHEWQAAVYSRTSKKSGCPFCHNFKLSVTNSLAAKAPALAKEWHPTKNRKLTPADVIAGGKQKVWWQCKKDKSHEWEADIYRRMRGSKCPDCSHQRVSKNNCLNKEFPYIAAQLHPTKNKGLTGDDIAVFSHVKVWWRCKVSPDHDWQATPANRTIHGSGCPYCTGRQVCSTNCLATLEPETAAQWDKRKNGKLTPKHVSPTSKQLAWWRCDNGHSWQQTIRKRVTSPITCWQCTGKTQPGVPAQTPKTVLKKLKAAEAAANTPKSNRAYK